MQLYQKHTRKGLGTIYQKINLFAAAGIVAAPTGKSNVNNWNYKMNITTTFNRESGECTKHTITQNCAKIKRNYCKKWNDTEESTKTIKLM